MKNKIGDVKMINLDKVRICAVIGDINSGKTNLAIYQLRQYKGPRKVYTLGYPKQIDNFISLNKSSDINKLTDSFILVDELSKFYPTKGRHTNNDFLKLARIMGHNNNTLVFTTQLTPDLTNQMESFVDTFLITRMADLRFLKFGSKAKYAIIDCADIRMTGQSLNLKQGEYLQSSDNSPIGEDGIKTFPFQQVGKDWLIKSQESSQASSQESYSVSNITSCVGLRRDAQDVAQAVAQPVAQPVAQGIMQNGAQGYSNLILQDCKGIEEDKEHKKVIKIGELNGI